MAHPKDILQSLGAAPLKSLSQNFLTSPHWGNTLVRAVLDGSCADEIWEIGPGLGALTQILVESTQKPVKLFEFDRKLSEYLRKKYSKLTLIEGDVLEADLAELSAGKKIDILSNLPYQISSPILFKVSEMRSQLGRLVFTFQREFAERVKAKVGDELYGALSVILQLQYNIKSLGILPKGAFYPEPGIDSEALLFTPNDRPDAEVKAIVPAIKGAFLHPRKKMVKNLKEVLGDLNWTERVIALGKTENARAEELSLEDFIKLCSP